MILASGFSPGVTRTRFSNRRLVENPGDAPRYDLASALEAFAGRMRNQHDT